MKSTKKIKKANQILTALIWQEDDLYVAKCLELSIASQGKTKRDALKSLEEALELYFEDETVPVLPRINKVTVEKLHLFYA